MAKPVAYYGLPSDHVWGRVEFSSLDAARMACWNDSTLYGLHDADAESTELDRLWETARIPKQLALFEGGAA